MSTNEQNTQWSVGHYDGGILDGTNVIRRPDGTDLAIICDGVTPEEAYMLAAAPSLLLALRAQQIASDIVHEGCRPAPDDPRFTEFIGEWNCYEAPELRWRRFVEKRRELRKSALIQSQLKEGQP